MAGAAVLAVSTAVAHADGGIPSSGEVTGVWTVSDTSTTFVDGALTFADGASVAIADESLFASAGRGGIPIAVAAGGIEGMPAMENYAFELKRSGVVNLHGGSRQIANLVSLGIRRMHQSVVVELNPVTEGMIERIRHMVTIEPVNE